MRSHSNLSIYLHSLDADDGQAREKGQVTQLLYHCANLMLVVMLCWADECGLEFEILYILYQNSIYHYGIAFEYMKNEHICRFIGSDKFGKAIVRIAALLTAY